MCDKCEKKFPRKYILSRHMRTHHQTGDGADAAPAAAAIIGEPRKEKKWAFEAGDKGIKDVWVELQSAQKVLPGPFVSAGFRSLQCTGCSLKIVFFP